MDLSHYYRSMERKLEKATHANCRLPFNKARGFLRMSDLAKSFYMLSTSSWQSLSIPQSKICTFFLMICAVTPGGGSQEQLLKLQVNCCQPEFAEQTEEGRRAWWMPAMSRMKYFKPGSKGEEGVRYFSWLLNSRNCKQAPLPGCRYKVSLGFENINMQRRCLCMHNSELKHIRNPVYFSKHLGNKQFVWNKSTIDSF